MPISSAARVNAGGLLCPNKCSTPWRFTECATRDGGGYKTINRDSARFKHALNKREIAGNVSKCEGHAQALQSSRDYRKTFQLHARAHQYQLCMERSHL